MLFAKPNAGMTVDEVHERDNLLKKKRKIRMPSLCRAIYEVHRFEKDFKPVRSLSAAKKKKLSTCPSTERPYEEVFAMETRLFAALDNLDELNVGLQADLNEQLAGSNKEIREHNEKCLKMV